MSRNKKYQKALKYLECADIPMLTMIGFGLGWMIVGTMELIFGVFSNAGEGEIWSFRTILSSLLCFGISVAMGLITKLYWWSVLRKSGSLFPRINGFALIFLVMSLLSAMLIAASYLYVN